MTHVSDDKKELVKDIHRLSRFGVRLEESSKYGLMVLHNSKSSLVVNVKSTQHLFPH